MYNVQDYSVLYDNAVRLWLTFYSHGKHLHDRITVLRKEVYVHKTILIPPRLPLKFLLHIVSAVF
jgi:hypothetical protein